MNNQYVIETPTGEKPFGCCVIGTGTTEEGAWIDAFGPKPWTKYNKICATKSWCRRIGDNEDDENDGDEWEFSNNCNNQNSEKLSTEPIGEEEISLTNSMVKEAKSALQKLREM
jgi:hypothetical protein